MLPNHCAGRIGPSDSVAFRVSRLFASQSAVLSLNFIKSIRVLSRSNRITESGIIHYMVGNNYNRDAFDYVLKSVKKEILYKR